VWATLGAAPESTRPHTGTSSRANGNGNGNGFQTRWPDDLDLIAAHGITQLRLTLDWARVCPRPGSVDGDSVEWYRDVLGHARSLGIDVWVTLLERDIPRWFDDERGFADPKNAARWWPRWVETATDVVGDLAAGWHPIEDPLRWTDRTARYNDGTVDHLRHGEVLDTLVVAWRDAWRILRGGPPVATALRVGVVRPIDASQPAADDARRRDHIMWTTWLRGLRDGSMVIPGRADRELADLAGAADVIGVGVSLSSHDLPAGRITDDALAQLTDRVGHHIRRAAEIGPDRPMQLSNVTFPAADLAARGHLLRAAAIAIDEARADGVPLIAAFAEPAIDAEAASTERAQGGLFTYDRNPTPALDAWLA
jgi:beta-glucosidase